MFSTEIMFDMLQKLHRNFLVTYLYFVHHMVAYFFYGMFACGRFDHAYRFSLNRTVGSVR